MRAIKYRELKRMYDLSGPEKTVRHLQEALRCGRTEARGFQHPGIGRSDAQRGAGAANGPAARRRVPAGGRRRRGRDRVFQHHRPGGAGADFARPTPRRRSSLSQLVETIPTRLDGERIPGIGRVSDEVAEVRPGMPYPSLGFAEDYIDTPQTTKRGFIVPVTKEAIFFDRTHLILQRAAEVGEVLGLNKEKRLIDLLIGATNNYKWKGAAYNTYSSSGTGAAPDGNWVNETDRGTGRLDRRGRRRATLRRHPRSEHGRAGADSGDHRAGDAGLPPCGAPHLQRHGDRTTPPPAAPRPPMAANPLGNYTVVDSRLAYRRLMAAGHAAADAKKWWFIGDFRKAFAYMENWPITVTQSPPDSEAEFNQDIVVRFKASERGAAAVINPRYVVKSTGAGSGT